MATERFDVVLSEEAASLVRAEAARLGKTESEVIELAVHRLVAPSVLDRLWARAELTEDEAMAVVFEEVKASRSQRRAS